MGKALENLSEVFLNQSENPAVIYGETKLTYRELYSRAATLARWFRSKGISNADTVAVTLVNSVDFVLGYFAAAIGGFNIVPINPLTSDIQKNYILRSARPKMVFTEKDVASAAEEHAEKVHPDYRFSFDPSLVFYTSGTTSTPKGVCHSFERMAANVTAFNELVGIDQDTRMLHIMPMSYMAGFLNTILSPIVAGGCVILAPVFSADAAMNFWPRAMHGRANSIWMSPTMVALLSRLNRSREIPEWTKRNLRQLFVGTAPLPPVVKQQFESTFNVECLESYGMTEILLVSCNTEDTASKNASVGRLLSGIEGKTVGKNGEDLADGQTGEVWIRSPYVLKGYIRNGLEEMDSPLRDGWFATGDIGFFDPGSGELFITGRIKDIIIHGGVNVSPRAVEEVLLSHGGVREAAVLGVPHEFWGEEVIAFVLQEAGVRLDMKDLRRYCETKLNPDAIPAKYIAINEFPRTETGKVKKEALKGLL